VVQHAVVGAQLPVFLTDGVEAVRAADHDLAVDGLHTSNSRPGFRRPAGQLLNRNSLPERRAESPLQLSPVPSTRYLTPAIASSSATALVVFLALSS